MLFYPFRSSDDLESDDGSCWKKFVEQLDLEKERDSSDEEKDDVVLPEEREEGASVDEDPSMWRRGFEILQNIQDRLTTEKNAMRARDLVQRATQAKADTGERKKLGIDEKEEDFDVDVEDFNNDDLDEMNDTTFQAGIEFSARHCLLSFCPSHIPMPILHIVGHVFEHTKKPQHPH